MKLWTHYQLTHTVEEAVTALAQAGGNAQIIAGGTDLLLDIQQGTHPVAHTLIDITRIPELTAITLEGDTAVIGAGVTHHQIVQHAGLRQRATSLVESCGVVGGPQVRNVATLGGNVAHALPAADGTLSLVALGATAEVADSTGRHIYPIRELFLGAGKSLVNPHHQLITRFFVPLSGTREASAFQRIMRPQGVALPILGCAAKVRLNAEGTHFEAVSLVLGPVNPTPMPASAVESALIDQPATAETIQIAAEHAKMTLHPRTSKYRATAEYRAEMIEVLVRGSLTAAVIRAQSGELTPLFEG
jgi:carbon-monoxide dehydrogenase medium subunit